MLEGTFIAALPMTLVTHEYEERFHVIRKNPCTVSRPTTIAIFPSGEEAENSQEFSNSNPVGLGRLEKVPPSTANTG